MHQKWIIITSTEIRSSGVDKGKAILLNEDFKCFKACSNVSLVSFSET